MVLNIRNLLRGALLLALFYSAPLYARSWEDLTEGENTAYGREREKKFPVRLFFLEIEKWQDHDAFHIFWLWGAKDYPRFQSSWVFPFYYKLQSKIDGRNFLLTPFYSSEFDDWKLSPPDENAENGKLQRSSWDYSVFWLFYRGEDNMQGSYTTLFPLFYFSREKNQALTFFTPLFYFSKDAANLSVLTPLFWYDTSPSTSTLITPLSVHSTSTNTTLRMILPIYLSYKEPGYKFHLNLAGVSLSEEENPANGFFFQKTGEQVVVDADVGWFYNLFRVSTRQTLSLPLGQSTKSEEENVKAEIPALVRERKHTRDDSKTFWGIYSLFGAVAYERADHYRHFRLLPFSWLTWSSEDTEKLEAVIPVYVHYHDTKNRYTVIAPLFVPLYGSEEKIEEIILHNAEKNAPPQTCQSYSSLWGVVLFINEFRCLDDEREKSFVWPLINMYTSPGAHGFRIFPLYWYKYAKKHYGFTTLHTVAGLFWDYRETQKDAAGKSEVFATQVSPLYLSIRQVNSSAFFSWLWYSYREESYFFRGIPLLYHQSEEKSSQTSTFYLFPFWFSHISPTSTTRIITPYFLSRSAQQETDELIFLIGRSRNLKTQETSWRALLYSVLVYSSPQRFDLKLGYGLLFSAHTSEKSWSWHTALVVGASRGTQNTTHNRLLPLWYYSASDSSRSLYLPIILSVFDTSQNGRHHFQAIALGLLWYDNFYADANRTRALLSGALWHHKHRKERDYDSYGSLFGLLWNYESETNYSRFTFLKFLYTRTETDGQTIHRVLGIRLN